MMARLADKERSSSLGVHPGSTGEALPVGPSVFVGREHERATLRAALDDALAGSARLILIAGEPGIGKTRLAAEAGADARAGGFHVLWGHSWEGGGAPSFWPWVQIARGCLRRRDPGDLDPDLHDYIADLSRLIPELAEQTPKSHASYDGSDLDTGSVRFRVFDSFASFLKRVAESQPLTLIMDDLHSVDTPSLVLLEFLAKELGDSRILLIATYRDVFLEPDGPLSRTLGQLGRHQSTQTLSLRGLSARDVARFIAGTGGSWSARLVNAVYEKSEGNPFFVTELVRLLTLDPHLQDSALLSSNLKIPHSVRDVVRRRLGDLPDECSEVLTVASVVGREFSLDLLACVIDLSRTRLLKGLDKAQAARLVDAVDERFGVYRFTHILIRDTLYEGLPAERRAILHDAIGRALEEVQSGDLDSSLEALAYHFFRAASCGDSGNALEYLLRAGKRAHHSLAYEDAVVSYQRALQLLGNEKNVESRRCELLLALGEAWSNAGDWESARETFRTAADTARALGAPEQLARAAVGFKGTMAAAGPADQEAIALLEETLQTLAGRDQGLRVRVLSALAMALYFTSATQRRAELSAQAVELGRRLGDSMSLSVALEATLYAGWRPSRLNETFDTATELVSVSAESGDPDMNFRGHLFRYMGSLQMGDASCADAELAHCLRAAEELRHPRYQWQMTLVLVARAMIRGDFCESERLCKEARELGDRVDKRTAEHYFLLQTFILNRLRGTFHEVDTSVLAIAAQYADIAAYRIGLASFLCAVGRVPEAEQAFESLASNDFTDLPDDAFLLFSLSVLAELCSFLHDVGRAETLYGLLLPYADHNVVVSWAAACDGSALHYLGILAGTMAHWEEAERHFQHALAMNAKLGAPPLVARTQHRYAEMLLARDAPTDRPKAERLFAQASATYERLGMQNNLVHRPMLPSRTEQLLNSADVLHGAVDRSSPGDSTPVNNSRISREGDFWTITYAGRVSLLKDSKGVQLIAHLLGRPGDPIHVLDLVGLLNRDPAPVVSNGIWQELEQGNLRIGRIGDAGAVLDDQARQRYRLRLKELQRELDEAEGLSDLGKAAQFRKEIESINAELRAGFGWGGRPRVAVSATERARVSVRNNIATALKVIQQRDTTLWRHLFNSIKTGTFCEYRPDPPITWTS